MVSTEAASRRRSQPVRHARTNPTRTFPPGARSREPLDSDPQPNQPIDIYPAVTHFADTMNALPKEIVRHFTLLKEVDAKIFTPEDQFFALVATTTEGPPSSSRVVTAQADGAEDTQAPGGSANTQQITSSTDGVGVPSPGGAASSNPSTYDPSNLQRRQLFRRTAYKIQELLVSLEEKNHVLSTANEVLQRQLARVDDVWPHLLDEFSDEAKWGSTTHWAYPENRLGKSSAAERTRRDGAAAISAAAQALADEAAARSDARKQAVQAKKGVRHNHNAFLESDLEEHDTKQGKKASHAKSRKTAEGSGTGLGISNTGPANGQHPPQKRRKVEKTSNGGVALERAPSGTMGSSAAAQKAKTNSPRATPNPDGPKKRRALPVGSSQVKKSKPNGSTKPASSTSSPIISSLPDPQTSARASPLLTSTMRPTSSRARGNSIQSNADIGKARPPSVAAAAAASAGRQNGKPPNTPELSTSNSWPKHGADQNKITKDATATTKNDATEREESERKDTGPFADNSEKGKIEDKQEEAATLGVNTLNKDIPSSSSDHQKGKRNSVDESDRKSEPAKSLPTVMATVTTKSGRASKPSTPALQQFQDATVSARPRSSRNADSGNGNGNGNGTANGTRKHQKRGSTASQAVIAKILANEDTGSSAPGDDDDGDIDADEPRYCYCNGVSYGEMVACDSDDCEREWFHLACVGLKTAPGQKTKWYCEDCKRRLQMTGKKVNGR